jgi:hypothetical protein
MLMEYIEKKSNYELLSFENWERKYKPIFNTKGSSIFFCTHSEEDRQFLKENQDKDALNIWTLVDGDGEELFIDSGYRFVNRIEYLITEVPRESKDILVQAEY